MKVRVKPSYRWSVITAFSGREFVKSEWRPVPAGYEEAAKNHELLEVEEEAAKPTAPPPQPAPKRKGKR